MITHRINFDDINRTITTESINEDNDQGDSEE